MTRIGCNCACGRYNPSFATVCAGCGTEGPRARRLRMQAEGERILAPLLRHFTALRGNVEATTVRMTGAGRPRRGARPKPIAA